MIARLVRRHARFLRRRLGRRIVLLFFACAVGPVVGFWFIAYHRVTHELEEQARDRLRFASKELGMSMLQRLQLAEAELERAAGEGPGRAAGPFRAFSSEWIPLTGPQRRHLGAGRSVLVTVPGPAGPTVRMGRALDPEDLSRGVLWAELERDYLWGAGATRRSVEPTPSLPPRTRLCVWNEAGGWPDCPPDLRRGLREASARAARGGTGPVTTPLSWIDGEAEHLAGRWTLHLRPAYAAPGWEIVLSEPAADALAPLVSLRRTLLLVLVLALLVVLFVSQVQIRRTLEPLEELKRGTGRIARRDFESRVAIRSEDEFEELGDAFNRMADQLGRQFRALLATQEIDRAILAALDARTIVDTVLRRAPEVIPGARATVTLLDCDGSGEGWSYRSAGDRPAAGQPSGDGSTGPQRTRLRAEEVAAAGGAARQGRSLVVPMRVEGELAGTLALEIPGRPIGDQDAEHARQLADHVAVALANARLVEELDRLNLQTLIAFARAIDAKSAWTAGHSERVTEVAVRIGEALGLDDAERERLRRGALLHDIGKIGIPGAILDKEGPLTDTEMEVMRSHPVIGARILQPITRFEGLVPIVRHHHERLDGGGYPDGIAGEAIHPLARIVSVADVYDALTSARPYRAARPVEVAVRIIVEGRGTAFEPRVVDAFLEMVGRPAVRTDSPSRGREPVSGTVALVRGGGR